MIVKNNFLYLSVSILFAAIIFAGCTSQAATDAITNSNEVIDSMNEFNNQHTPLMTQLDSHTDIWNNEIDKASPNYRLLYANLENDRTGISNLNTILDDVDEHITTFAGTTVHLNGNVKAYAEQAASKMRLWHDDISESLSDRQQYNSYQKLYLDTVKAGNPNDLYYRNYNNAHDKASAAIDRANKEKSDMNDLLEKIEQLQ